jgi:hypothetical protein
MRHEQTRRLAAILSTRVTVIRERCQAPGEFVKAGNALGKFARRLEQPVGILSIVS